MLALLLMWALDFTALDDSIRTSLERRHAPGAVVAVVRDGEVAYLKGHGFADWAARREVDAERSAFRTGSVSKVITALVVMDQVRQGRLRLDEDISGRLTGLPSPLTLAQLLTHTAGFDDRYIGKSARTFEEALPLAVFLGRFRPARILPPGEVLVYSNYGYALAGFLAEQSAGRPFAALAEERVFQPFEMRHSTFLLPREIREQAARPHFWNGAGYEALEWDYLQDAPAGMHMSSGGDMARLMIQLLRDPERDAFKSQFTHHERIEGAMGWGFFLGQVRGIGWAGHDGGYAGVAARLRMFPELRTGYFVAVNASAIEAVQEIGEAVERLILPGVEKSEWAAPEARQGDAGRFTGWYRMARYPRDTIEKVGLLFGALGGDLRIGSAAGGMLMMPKLDGAARRMVQVAPLLWESVDDDYRCAFRADSRGQVTHLFTDGTTALERVPWRRTVVAQRGIFFFCMTMFFALALTSVRKQFLPELLRAPAAVAAHAFLLHFAGLGVVMQVMVPAYEREMGFAYGLPPLMGVVQVLPLLGLSAFGWFLVRMVSSRGWKTPGPLGLAGVFLIYAGWLTEWNLLGWRY